MRVTISARGIILTAPAVGIVLLWAWSTWLTCQYGMGVDGWHEPVCILTSILLSVVAFFGCGLGAVVLWDRNPSVTIGRKEKQIPEARVVP